jgi:hypothetical protein
MPEMPEAQFDPAPVPFNSSWSRVSNSPVFTFDIDWAPDFVIDWVSGQLRSQQIHATWFVTHASPAVDRLRHYPDIFELGIHPNLLPGSTHGHTPEAVLDHCMALVPEARSLRTHGLLQSSPLLKLIVGRTPITTDVSLCLPYTPYLRPVDYKWKQRSLLRIPFFWEDDFEMERLAPCWHLESKLAVGDGLKVFNFHPIHVYLNSADMRSYEMLKKLVPDLGSSTPGDTDRFVNAGVGSRTLFYELLEYLSRKGHSLCIRDLANEWREAL